MIDISKIFYIADWHYDHKNIISFDNRPYNNINEMNEDLIKRWNSVVSKEDTIYVLGDMFWCKPDEAVKITDQLNGTKILVKGNHDRINNEFAKHFHKVVDYLEIKDNGRHVVLCHYPIPCFNRHYYGAYHLYGHVHSGFEWNMMENVKLQMTELYNMPCNMYNVGCMMSYINFTPKTLDQIIKGANND